MKIVYLNGEFLPLAEARVPVTDRGFLFADGVYEVIPVYNQQPFRLKEHLKRMQISLEGIQLVYKLEPQQWEKIFAELITANLALNGENQFIYFQITRGAPEDRAHPFPTNTAPTIFAQASAFKQLSLDELNQGMHAITAPDIRWQNCHIKSIALLANVMLFQQAKNVSAHETILLRDGKVIEGATSNVFIVKSGILKTPPLSNLLLAGITREFVLELAKKYHIPMEETNISEAELRAADEVWITSSTKEIYPIVKLDNKPIGGSKPGPVWEKMIRYYRDNINSKQNLIKA